METAAILRKLKGLQVQISRLSRRVDSQIEKEDRTRKKEQSENHKANIAAYLKAIKPLIDSDEIEISFQEVFAWKPEATIKVIFPIGPLNMLLPEEALVVKDDTIDWEGSRCPEGFLLKIKLNKRSSDYTLQQTQLFRTFPALLVRIADALLESNEAAHDTLTTAHWEADRDLQNLRTRQQAERELAAHQIGFAFSKARYTYDHKLYEVTFRR